MDDINDILRTALSSPTGHRSLEVGITVYGSY